MKKLNSTIALIMANMILILLLSSVYAMAQTKKDTVPKKSPVVHPAYTFDGNRPEKITITFTLPAQFVDNYIYVENIGGIQGLDYSQDLKAIQATQLKNVHKLVLDSLNSNLFKQHNQYLINDKARFTADTLQLYHPKSHRP